MSKLDELIKELCPNGCEYKTLKEVCTDIIVPMRDRPKVFDGNIPWCRIEDKEGHYFNKSLSGLGVTEEVVKKMNLKIFPTGTVICSCSASLGAYAINTQPLITNQTFIGLVCGENLFNKYLLYYMETQTTYLKGQASTGTIPYISRQKFENMQIPVPPMAVQEEIVRILDNFTSLTAELTAELTARKKQYEYYRDELLTFGDVQGGTALRECGTALRECGMGNVECGMSGRSAPNCNNVTWKPLGEVCNLQSGKAISAYLISDIQTAENPIPCYGANGLRGYVSTSNESGDKPIIGRQGALCGNVCFATGSYYATEHAVVVTDNGFFNSRFLYHLLVNADLNQYKTAGAQPGLSVARLNEVKVPVPARNVQDKIAEVLDNFDAICSDLKIGLPAEIEARQKQYEFYRDALLNYAAKGVAEL